MKKFLLTLFIISLNTLILIVAIDMFATYFIYKEKTEFTWFFCETEDLSWACPKPSPYFYWSFLGLGLKNFLYKDKHDVLPFDELDQSDRKSILRPWKSNDNSRIELPWKKDSWVDYYYDDLGRRVPKNPSKEVKDSSFIFLGGSWVHGDYLPYEDSLPGKFEEISKHRTYNYGVRGGGLQEAFLWAQSADFSSHIPESNNTFIYTYLSFHLSRLRPSVNRGPLNFALAMTDYIHSNELGYAGTFNQAFPVLVPGLSFIYYSGLGKMLGLRNKNFPEWENESLFCDMLVQMKKKLKEKRPSSKFYVLSYEYKLEDFLLNCLNDNEINWILPLFDGDLVKTNLPDGHPDAQTHESVAEYLKKQIISDSTP